MANKRVSLDVINGATATFECIYGRGCEGICCQNGRPPVAADEAKRIDANMRKILPLLTTTQQKSVTANGYVSKRTKSGKPMLRVLGGWCVFFNEGCVLHKLGASEGDKFKYKPAPCSLFPLERDDDTNDYYIRQHGYKGEQWGELFCLNPAQTARLAVETLAEEMEFAKNRARGSA